MAFAVATASFCRQLTHDDGVLGIRTVSKDVRRAKAALREVICSVVVGDEGAAQLLSEIDAFGFAGVLGGWVSACVQTDEVPEDACVIRGHLGRWLGRARRSRDRRAVGVTEGMACGDLGVDRFCPPWGRKVPMSILKDVESSHDGEVTQGDRVVEHGTRHVSRVGRSPDEQVALEEVVVGKALGFARLLVSFQYVL